MIMELDIDKEYHELKPATTKCIYAMHNQQQAKQYDNFPSKNSSIKNIKNIKSIKNMEILEIEKQPAYVRKKPELLESWRIVFGAALAMFLTVGFVASYGLLYVVLLEKFQESAASTAAIGALCCAIGNLLGRFIISCINYYPVLIFCFFLFTEPDKAAKDT